MVQKFFALTDNYQDMIEFFSEKLHEPITAQYLNNCLQNATYKINTLVESILDPINVYFKAITLKEIQQANFLSIYADESENSLHKECFSMFMSYYCKQDEIVNTKSLGIVRLTNLSSAEIMDVLKKFLTSKNIDLSKILFSVLDGTNSMSGKHKGLQRWIQNESPFTVCKLSESSSCFMFPSFDEDERFQGITCRIRFFVIRNMEVISLFSKKRQCFRKGSNSIPEKNHLVF